MQGQIEPFSLGTLRQGPKKKKVVNTIKQKIVEYRHNIYLHLRKTNLWLIKNNRNPPKVTHIKES